MAQKITSLTLANVAKFEKEAKPKDRLQCHMIAGFHLYKNAKGASYRFRYTDIKGKVKNKVLGKASELKPVQAAEIALDIKVKGVDLFEQERQRKQQHFEQEHLSIQRSFGVYLNGMYAKHQARKRSGHETILMLRKNFAHLFNRDMSQITSTDIKVWQLQRENEVVFSTIQRAYGALKTMFNKAVIDGVLEVNPLPSKSPLERPHFEEIDKQRDIREKRRLFSREELEKLFIGIEAYNEDLKRQRAHSIKRGRVYLEPLENKRFAHWSIPFVYVAYFTGMRTGDIKSLTWLELNLNFKRLSFTPSKTRHHPDPITVTLDLPDSIIELMRQWQQQSKTQGVGLVFPSEKTGKGYDKHAHITHWNRILCFAGLPEELDFYSLRHHWISTLLQTENLLQVARMAGHKSTKMIEKHYGHLIPDRAKNALQAFDLKNVQQSNLPIEEAK